MPRAATDKNDVIWDTWRPSIFIPVLSDTINPLSCLLKALVTHVSRELVVDSAEEGGSNNVGALVVRKLQESFVRPFHSCAADHLGSLRGVEMLVENYRPG